MINLKRSFISSFFAILLSCLMLGQTGYAQGPVTVILGTGPSGQITQIQTDANGNLALSGTITGGNGAASNTGSAVPAQAGYTGLNVSGTLRGATGTNTSGSVYALDINCVQGCSGGTAQGAATSGVTGPLGLGSVTTVAPTYTNATVNALSLDTAGSLRVVPMGTVTVGQLTASNLNTLAQLTTSTAQIGHLEANQSTNIAQINAVTPLMGNGASGTGSLRVTIADNSTGILAQVTNVATIGTSVTPGTGATNLGKAISAVVGATDTGVAALFQRFDSPTTVESTGDYVVPRTDSVGRLWVNCGTGCSGGTQYAVDAVAGASDTGTLALVVRDDSLATLTPADGDYTQLRTTSTGALWVQSATSDAAAGAAVTTNPVQTGGVYTNSPLTLDPGDAGYFLLDVNGRMQVSDGAGALNVICDSGCSGGVQYTQDAALTVATSVGGMAMGRASAAVPTDVSADNDAVMPWYLRSGAVAVQLTNAGVLTLSGSGTATGALRVELPTNGTGTIASITTSITPGNGVANLGKAEDAAIGSGDTGVAALFQAQATPTATAADNDYILAKTNANGVLWSQPLSTSATGAAPPAMASFTGGLGSGATGGFLIGVPVCDSFARLNISTGTTTLAVTGVSGRHVRICSIDIVTAAANNVALISGTGATCGTGTAGMNGGTTAASGWNFAANGGIAKGSGIGSINQTVATGDSVCVVTSATTQLSGTIAYTIY